MKTPMQEHIEWLKNERTRYINKAHEESSERVLGFVYKMDDCIKHAETMLEKEKEVMYRVYKAHNPITMIDGNGKEVVDGNHMKYKFDNYYNETFNTNQENLQDSTNGYTYYPQENKTVFNTKEK